MHIEQNSKHRPVDLLTLIARRFLLDRSTISWLGLVLGPLLAVAVYASLPDADAQETIGLTPGGRATAAVATWMACWWLTEAVPLAATALLPIVLFPLSGAATVAEATAPYSRSLIFLFMGGFILGLGMQRWGLHRRIALLTVLRVGTQPVRLIAGFMLATAVLSMWISNTATVIMLFPIGLSILQMCKQRSENGGRKGTDPAYASDIANFGTALMLGIAYAASIGGVGTLIGTPPNLVLASFLKERYGFEITMLGWLKIGLPLVIVFLPIAWFYLTRIAYPVRLVAIPGGQEVIENELHKLGPMTRGERIVLFVFAATALGWILRPQLAHWTGLTGLNDAVIAITGALLLFVIPVDATTRTFAMNWDTAKKLPWDILILFGGGLSLASAITKNGVDLYIASGFVELKDVTPFIFVLAVSSVVIFLTEITSNTAVTTTLMPVLAATAIATGMPPGLLLTAAAMSASCAFMLPVATPPNAIVFSSGHVTIAQMAKAGLGLNLIAIVLVSTLVYFGGHALIAA